MEDVLEITKALEQARLNNDSNTIAYLERILAEKKQSAKTIKAKQTEYNGVNYASGLEAYFAKRCDELSLSFTRQVVIHLQDGFDLFGERVPPIKIKVDFLVEEYAFVDPKGMLMPDFELKWHMLKNKFREDYEYFLPRNKKEVELVLEKIVKAVG